MASEKSSFVSRAGEKLNAALDAFGIDVREKVCADFGANVGGFTDCLLRRGAKRVYAIDTAYGELAWRLRKDDRVVVMERTNALYCSAPESVALVTIDTAWTPQSRSVPAAASWLGPGAIGIVSLLKPHYELAKMDHKKPAGPLSAEVSASVCEEVCRQLTDDGFVVRAWMPSPLLGKGGNTEYLLWVMLGDPGATESSPSSRQQPVHVDAHDGSGKALP